MHFYGCKKVDNGDGIKDSWLDFYERFGVNNIIKILFLCIYLFI